MTPVTEILSRLVSYPVLGGQSNLSILKYIEDYLSYHKVEYFLEPNEEGTQASLHCRIGPEVDEGVILSGHMDVVPIDGQNWDTDPFQLLEKNGKLYARGACDMKGFLACCLASLPEMLNAKLKKPIYFAFSYDEELGCRQGERLAKAIKSHYKENPKYAIIGEPTLMKPMIGQKGIIFCETSVFGSAGHSSRIRNEVSAIHEATHLMLWLENKMDELIREGYTDNRFEPNHTSIHIGMIEGGIAPNVIADKCIFKWDVRNIPSIKIEEVINDFESFCKEKEKAIKCRFSKAKIKTIKLFPPVPSLDTSIHSPIVNLIKNLLDENAQIFGAVSYATEAGQFSETGFEAVICGPGSIAQAHRANEFISRKQLEEGLLFMRNLTKILSR